MNRLGDQTQTTHAKLSSNTPRLLINKLVYLDLNTSCKNLAKLREYLIKIGANLADCMSKDVNYVITNRVKLDDLHCQTSKCAHDNQAIQKTSPTAMNFSRSSAINRTQQILGNASKGNTCNDIISIARKLGISVFHLSEIERYVEKYVQKCKTNQNAKSLENKHLIETDLVNNRTSKVRKLKAPYLKFESICKQYKPIYAEFSKWHELVLDSMQTSHSSPFQVYFSDENDKPNASSENQNIETPSRHQASTHLATQNASPCNQQSSTFDTQLAVKTPFFQRTNSTLSTTPTTTTNTTTPRTINLRAPIQPKQSSNVPLKKKGGYCECCKQRFDNLKQHLTSIVHENYEKNSLNFKDIDALAEGVLNFDIFLRKYNPVILRESQKEVEIIVNDNKTHDSGDETIVEENLREEEQIIEQKAEEIMHKNHNTELQVHDCNIYAVSNDTESSLKVKKPLKSRKKNHLMIERDTSKLTNKRRESRAKSHVKYTELTEDDLNSILAATSDDLKTKKRKRKETLNESSATTASKEVAKPKIKLKLELNKNNNSWQVSSSSIFEASEKTPVKCTENKQVSDPKRARLMESSSYNSNEYPRSASVPSFSYYQPQIPQFQSQQISPYFQYYQQFQQYYTQPYIMHQQHQQQQQQHHQAQSSFQRSYSFNNQQQSNLNFFYASHQQPQTQYMHNEYTSIFETLAAANSLINQL